MMDFKMIYYLSQLIILSSALYLETLASSPIVLTGNQNQHIHASEPHVAFLCGKPSMHLKQGQWIADYDQNCITDPEQILTYCKKIYPNLGNKIVNVEPSSVLVSINSWCSLKEEGCSPNRGHTTHEVRPYRCLLSPVVSEPLIVSPMCHFGHLNYEPEQHCEIYDYWNATAKKQCETKGHILESFGVLFPCIKDKKHKTMYFSGVEFVCCPMTQTKKTPKGYIINHKENPSQSKNADDGEQIPRAYKDYLDKPEDLDSGQSEHDRYDDAKSAIKEYMQTKFKKLENELADSQQNLDSQWRDDPNTAQSMQREIQTRFKTLYKSLADQEVSILRQLDDVHQQRVLKMLNTRRDNAMKVLDYILQENNPQKSRIVEALDRVIRILEKAKVHAINHYEHVRVRDPGMALKRKAALEPYLKHLDQEIQDALNKLDKVPSLKESIMKLIAEFLARYKEVDISAKEALLADIPAIENTNAQSESILSKYRSLKSPEIIHLQSKNEESQPHDDGQHQTKVHTKQDHSSAMYKPQHPGAETHVKWMDSPEKLNHFYHGKDSTEIHSTGMVVAVVVAVLAAVILLGVAITIVVRHRSQYNRSHAGYTMSVVELDKNEEGLKFLAGEASPKIANKGIARRPQSLGSMAQPQIVNDESMEDCQLTSMQMTGYENPTYKYFEKPVANSPGK